MPYSVLGHDIVLSPTKTCQSLAGEDVIGVDLESTGFNPWKDRIATIQLYGDRSGTAALIQTPGGVVPEPVKKLLGEHRGTLIFHNGVSFDIPFLYTHGVDVTSARCYDTLVAETAIVPTQRRDVRKNLQASVKRRLGFEVNKKIEHSGWANDELTEEQVLYAMTDVLHLPALMRAQQEAAAKYGVTAGLEFEQALVPAVAWLTINGMPISKAKLDEYLAKQVADIGPVTDTFLGEFGALNARSPKQILDAFHSREIMVPNTRKETLQDLVLAGGEAGRLASIIMEYRRPDQRLKVYGGDWLGRYQQPDGRVHFRFWQCATDTTRFSSSDPNGEQIPRDMRRVFGWEEGMKIVKVDLSQVEIRVAAAIAQDRVLLEVLEQEDVHAAMGSEVLGVPIGEITFDQRKLAKAMSFTLLFGGGAAAFYDYARRGGGVITENQAHELVDRFFERFEGLARLRKRAQEKIAYANGDPITVKIQSGLKRMLIGKSLKSTVLLNTLVQSTAAAGIKFGIMEAWNRGLVRGRMCNQVHDELDAVVPANEAVEYAAELTDALLTGFRRAIECKPRAESKIADFWEN